MTDVCAKEPQKSGEDLATGKMCRKRRCSPPETRSPNARPGAAMRDFSVILCMYMKYSSRSQHRRHSGRKLTEHGAAGRFQHQVEAEAQYFTTPFISGFWRDVPGLLA